MHRNLIAEVRRGRAADRCHGQVRRLQQNLHGEGVGDLATGAVAVLVHQVAGHVSDDRAKLHRVEAERRLVVELERHLRAAHDDVGDLIGHAAARPVEPHDIGGRDRRGVDVVVEREGQLAEGAGGLADGRGAEHARPGVIDDKASGVRIAADAGQIEHAAAGQRVAISVRRVRRGQIEAHAVRVEHHESRHADRRIREHKIRRLERVEPNRLIERQFQSAWRRAEMPPCGRGRRGDCRTVGVSDSAASTSHTQGVWPLPRSADLEGINSAGSRSEVDQSIASIGRAVVIGRDDHAVADDFDHWIEAVDRLAHSVARSRRGGDHLVSHRQGDEVHIGQIARRHDVVDQHRIAELAADQNEGDLVGAARNGQPLSLSGGHIFSERFTDLCAVGAEGSQAAGVEAVVADDIDRDEPHRLREVHSQLRPAVEEDGIVDREDAAAGRGQATGRRANRTAERCAVEIRRPQRRAREYIGQIGARREGIRVDTQRSDVPATEDLCRERAGRAWSLHEGLPLIHKVVQFALELSAARDDEAVVVVRRSGDLQEVDPRRRHDEAVDQIGHIAGTARAERQRAAGGIEQRDIQRRSIE